MDFKITYWKKPVMNVGDLRDILNNLDREDRIFCTDAWSGDRMPLHAAEHNQTNHSWFGEIWIPTSAGKISLVNREGIV